MRAIDRHFSQTTVQRTPQAKEQKKSERRGGEAGMGNAAAACPPDSRPARRRRGERLLRSAVAANISMNMMQYGLWGEGEQYIQVSYDPAK